MRIHLFNPSVHHYSPVHYRMNPPLSLPILAAVLTNAGHEVRVWDLEALRIPPAALGATFAKQRDAWPDAVGFTATMHNGRGLRESIAALRGAGYGGYIIVGGPQATVEGRKGRNPYGADALVVGECEGNVVEVFEAQPRGVVEGRMVPIADIPGPLWPVHHPQPTGYLGNMPDVGKPEGIAMWSRGCPHRCVMCVTGDTEVWIGATDKPIASLRVGDEVWAWQEPGVVPVQVSAKQRRLFDGDLVRLNVQGLAIDLSLTPDHEVPIVRKRELNRMAPLSNVIHREKWLSEVVPVFTRSDQIQPGDFVVVPYGIAERDNSWSEAFCELAGLYLARGSVSAMRGLNRKPGGYQVHLDFSQAERELAEHALDLLRLVLGKNTGTIFHNKRNATLRVTMYGREDVRRFKDLFGTGSKKKRLPEEALWLPRIKQGLLVKGMFWGDGHNARKSVRYTTVSRLLAEQLRLILLRLGCIPNVFRIAACKRPPTVQGRKVRVSDTYAVSMFGPGADDLRALMGWPVRNGNANRRFNRAYNVPDRGLAFYPVRSVERIQHRGPVYDITTNGTFLARGVAVSNCANPVFGQRPVRRRSPQAIRDDMAALKALGCQSVFVYDDELAGAPGADKWLVEVCEAIADLRLTWKCQGRCTVRMSRAVLQAMYDAGCRAVMWGVESFSDGVLKAMRKGIIEADISHTLRVAREVGIGNWVFLMVGNYQETPRELAYTERRLTEAVAEGLVQWRQVTVCTPVEGTRLYDLAREEGWLMESPEGGPQMAQVYAPTPWLTEWDIRHWHDRLRRAGL